MTRSVRYSLRYSLIYVHVPYLLLTCFVLLQCSHYTEVMEAVKKLVSLILSVIDQKLTALTSAVMDVQNSSKDTKLLRPPPRHPISIQATPTTPLSSTPRLSAPWYMSESFVDAGCSQTQMYCSLQRPPRNVTSGDTNNISIPMDCNALVRLRYISVSRRNFAVFYRVILLDERYQGNIQYVCVSSRS